MKRGKYKIVEHKDKHQAVALAKRVGIKEASKTLFISEKNIRRWTLNGVSRKQGAGRKVNDADMEKQLLEWVAEFYKEKSRIPENRELKKKALSIA